MNVEVLCSNVFAASINRTFSASVTLTNSLLVLVSMRYYIRTMVRTARLDMVRTSCIVGVIKMRGKKMLTKDECLKLHAALSNERRAPGKSNPLADVLVSLYAIAVELTDIEDRYQACEDMVSEAMTARDEADVMLCGS